MDLNFAFIIALFLHWLGDFVLQTDYQARNKSTSDRALSEHVLTYALVWVIPSVVGAIYFNSGALMLFPIITFIVHWITDYHTSRVNKRLWEAKKVHEFFVSVGFDQILHYLQLYLTFKLLS